nr:MAG TPA: hypothetical protein [Caudoviricetes sp.]
MPALSSRIVPVHPDAISVGCFRSALNNKLSGNYLRLIRYTKDKPVVPGFFCVLFPLFFPHYIR